MIMMSTCLKECYLNWGFKKSGTVTVGIRAQDIEWGQA